MHNLFTPGQWVTWSTVLVAQSAVAVPAWKRYKPLAVYLSGLALSSLCGMAVVLFASSPSLYLSAYIAAGYFELALTSFLLVALLNDVRLRALSGRQDVTYVAALVCFGLAFALLLCRDQISGHSSGLTAMRVAGYFGYTGMAIVLLLSPIYAWLIIAVPKWNSLFRLIAFSVVVCLHASYVDRFLSIPNAHSKLLKAAHDYVYLVPLTLWFFSLPPAARPRIARTA